MQPDRIDSIIAGRVDMVTCREEYGNTVTDDLYIHPTLSPNPLPQHETDLLHNDINNEMSTLGDWLLANKFTLEETVHYSVLAAPLKVVNYQDLAVEIVIKDDEEMIFDGRRWILQKRRGEDELPAYTRSATREITRSTPISLPPPYLYDNDPYRCIEELLQLLGILPYIIPTHFQGPSCFPHSLGLF